MLAPHLAATVARLHERLDAADVDELGRRIGTRLRRETRPEPLAPLAQLAAAQQLDAHTRLRLRAGLRLRVDEDAGGIRLVSLGQTVDLPAAAGAAVKTIVTGVPFTPDELPDLDAGEQLTLARRLLREGIVVPA